MKRQRRPTENSADGRGSFALTARRGSACAPLAARCPPRRRPGGLGENLLRLRDSQRGGRGVQGRSAILPVIIWRAQLKGCFLSWHSQTLTTVHPSDRNSLVTLRSRRLFSSIFCSHNSAFRRGLRFLPHACPCQKHPSTKRTSFACAQTKSGFPGRG